MWPAPCEQGVGTITVRFMMDDLRANRNGFPTGDDLQIVRDFLNTVRPVTTKDYFVKSPIPEEINFILKNLVPDSASVRSAVIQSVKDMLKIKARPSYAVNGTIQPPQTIFAAWVSEAIMQTSGVESFDLVMDDHLMPNKGSMGVMGSMIMQFT